jgi:hypothetical protein
VLAIVLAISTWHSLRVAEQQLRTQAAGLLAQLSQDRPATDPTTALQLALAGTDHESGMPRASPVPAQRLMRSVRLDEAGARLEKGKAFLAYQGGYMVTTDPAKIAENDSLRMGRINTELRRVLSGSINALGEQVADYEVLACSGTRSPT